MWARYMKDVKAHQAFVDAQPKRRALFGLELNIAIALPNVGFKLPLGSHSIGAEFGLSFSTAATLYFS
jgi:hypothetical protein